jgi:hypothetical protein
MRICSRAEAVVIAAAVAMGACAVDPPDSETPAVAQAEAALNSQCTSWQCGANSPVVDTRFAFHDLSLLGRGRFFGGTTEPNEVGIAIVAAGRGRRAQIVQGGQSYDLHVIDGRFVGTSPVLGAIQGTALVGATITLTVGSVPRYVITIATVRQMSYFVGVGTVEPYTLLWTDLAGGPTTNLCSEIPLLEKLLAGQAGDDNYARQELMGLRTTESVIFEGDRIDAHAKTMSLTADDTWFNIGCASHNLAKLRLTQNTIHSQAPGLPRAWERRQATMKLYAAAYCGDGTPLTVAGQRLVWQGDLMGYFFGDPERIEARWDQTGATCLHAPRMLYPTSSFGASTFPDIKSSIEAACKQAGKQVPQDCSNQDPREYIEALRVSADPKS